MEKVLARREVNRQTLQQYILDEAETFEVLGPGRVAALSLNREFRWYRPRRHARAQPGPLRRRDRRRGAPGGSTRTTGSSANGERLERQSASDERTGKGSRNEPAEPTPVSTGGRRSPTPRFVSEAYFMDFKFEPGNYYLAGREQLEGKEVLRIEYLPDSTCSDDDDDRERDRTNEPRTRQRRNAERAAKTRQGARVRAGHRAQDEQDGDGHAVDRSRRTPDRQVHVRQRLDGLPARRAGWCVSTISAPR